MYAARKFQSGNVYIIEKDSFGYFRVVEVFQMPKPGFNLLSYAWQKTHTETHEDIEAETIEDAKNLAVTLVL